MTGFLRDELHAFRRTCLAAGLHITASDERQKFFSEFRLHSNIDKKDAKSHSKHNCISVKTSYVFRLYIAINRLNINQ
jgi:hypothetical protein